MSQKPRRTEVRAIAPTVLLTFDDTRFRRLLRRNPSITTAVRRSAQARGVSEEPLDIPGASAD